MCIRDSARPTEERAEEIRRALEDPAPVERGSKRYFDIAGGAAAAVRAQMERELAFGTATPAAGSAVLAPQPLPFDLPAGTRHMVLWMAEAAEAEAAAVLAANEEARRKKREIRNRVREQNESARAKAAAAAAEAADDAHLTAMLARGLPLIKYSRHGEAAQKSRGWRRSNPSSPPDEAPGETSPPEAQEAHGSTPGWTDARITAAISHAVDKLGGGEFVWHRNHVQACVQVFWRPPRRMRASSTMKEKVLTRAQGCNTHVSLLLSVSGSLTPARGLGFQ